MNGYLENEAFPVYAVLGKMVEAMPVDEWLDPETERRIWDLDDALSKMLKQRNVTHYTIPFKDRPEIAIVSLGKETARTEVEVEMGDLARTLKVVDEH
jgi:hypothetical protein